MSAAVGSTIINTALYNIAVNHLKADLQLQQHPPPDDDDITLVEEKEDDQSVNESHNFTVHNHTNSASAKSRCVIEENNDSDDKPPLPTATTVTASPDLLHHQLTNSSRNEVVHQILEKFDIDDPTAVLAASYETLLDKTGKSLNVQQDISKDASRSQTQMSGNIKSSKNATLLASIDEETFAAEAASPSPAADHHALLNQNTASATKNTSRKSSNDFTLPEIPSAKRSNSAGHISNDSNDVKPSISGSTSAKKASGFFRLPKI